MGVVLLDPSAWLYTTKEFDNSLKKKQKTERKENRTSAIVLDGQIFGPWTLVDSLANS